jgi:hypothetical protein
MAAAAIVLEIRIVFSYVNIAVQVLRDIRLEKNYYKRLK